ncbi:hypothetical protein GCM10028807_55530 [Spirosoma daeguense]
METLHFQTNINTSEDVAVVTLPLNNIEQIDGWNIDTDSTDKLLTVQTTDNRITDLVEKALRNVGFAAQKISRDQIS